MQTTKKISFFKKIKENSIEDNSIYFLNLAENSEVIKLTSDKNYTNIHFKNGRVLRSANTLLKFVKLLKENKNYVRVNRATVINTQFLKLVDVVEGKIILEQLNANLTETLAYKISRRREKKVLENLEEQGVIVQY